MVPSCPHAVQGKRLLSKKRSNLPPRCASDITVVASQKSPFQSPPPLWKRNDCCQESSSQLPPRCASKTAVIGQVPSSLPPRFVRKVPSTPRSQNDYCEKLLSTELHHSRAYGSIASKGGATDILCWISPCQSLQVTTSTEDPPSYPPSNHSFCREVTD